MILICCCTLNLHIFSPQQFCHIGHEYRAVIALEDHGVA